MLGDRIERPRLLSCYIQTPAGLRGHTVLTYSTPSGFYLLDPTISSKPRAVPSIWRDNPEALAGLALDHAKIVQARWVPTDAPQVSLVAQIALSDAHLTAENGTPHATQ
jgi:hypothetical protein